MRLIKYFLSLLICSILGCNESQKKTPTPVENGINVEKQKKILTSENNKKIGSDTLNIPIGHFQILAFCLTQKEYDNLSEDAAGEYNENYADLKYYLGQVADSIKNNNILISETASTYIKIGNLVIDRRSLKTSLGLMFITKLGKYEIVNNGLLVTEIEDKVKSMDSSLRL